MRSVSPERMTELVAPGHHLYIPGAVTMPAAFLDALSQVPELSRDLHLVTSIAPGIDSPLDPAKLHRTARITGLFMREELREAHREGRYRLLPTSYGGFVRYLRERAQFDLTVVQVAPPDARGRCSLGPSVEFAPLAVACSRHVLALINTSLPTIPGAASLPIERIDYACEIDAQLPEYRCDIDDTTRTIAANVASLIDDGSTLQMGLGKVPAALFPLLRGHRRLRMHSGMLSDGLQEMLDSGSLDPEHTPICCVLAGTRDLYRWAATSKDLRVAGCEVTHDSSELLALERFIAVNSALEIDLFGQCNLEHAEGRAISGAGGAPDFARAARLSSGGRSIIALNASYRKGHTSRIVPSLDDGGVVSLPRYDIDFAVTEFGIADLRDASVHERAQSIIGIAAPQCRAELQAAWERLAARL